MAICERQPGIAMQDQAVPEAGVRPDLLRRRIPTGQRKRGEISCDNCRARKQKCRRTSSDEPCSYCMKLGVTCLATKPRKPRSGPGRPTDNKRIEILERLVHGLIPEADLADVTAMRDMGSLLGIPMPDESVLDEPPPELPDLRERLLQDGHGTTQYIGPSSSYFFMTEVCSAVGASSSPTSQDICKTLNVNSTQQDRDLSPASTVTTQQTRLGYLGHAPVEFHRRVDWYFANVHADFTIFHEASFRETYEAWIHTADSPVDPTWACSLLGVLLLSGNPATSSNVQQDQELWSKAHEFLSRTLLMSSLGSVQGLMVLALYLHNTNRRDACWTLTGAAVRIAMAIGMHQNDVQGSQTPLFRMLRRRIWYTLYAFEQMQVSSLGRPSALSQCLPTIETSCAETMGTGACIPPEYMGWHNKLAILLGKACETAKTTSVATTSNAGPLSPAASLLRELKEWEEALPRHLQLGSLEYLPPNHQRPVLLLHVQYHYIISYATRWALLSNVSIIKSVPAIAVPQRLSDMARACVDAGQASCALLLRLDAMGKFNATTWWDVFWLYSTFMTVTFGIHLDAMRSDAGPEHSAYMLLKDASSVMEKHLHGPAMAPTMRRWANIVVDVHTSTSQSTMGEVNGRADSDFAVSPTLTASLGEQPKHYWPEIVDRCDSQTSEPLGPNNPSMDFDDVSRAFEAVNWDDVSNMLLNAEFNCV